MGSEMCIRDRSVGTPISQELMSGLDSDQKSDFLRLQVYLKDSEFDPSWPASSDDVVEEKPLGPEPDQSLIRDEIDGLPGNQKVADFKQFSTYYGYQEQMPAVVQEISRLRELTFRTMDEGSGEAYDTDEYDATYTHLFVCDNSNDGEIIAAYRMGQTDRLQEKAGIDGIYLSQMFKFGANFLNQREPCLEMGRSFIVPKHQRTFYGLSLLWKGIGGFLAQHHRYRYLYGTVSLSKLYRISSVSLMKAVLVQPGADVQPRIAYDYPVHPEVSDYLAKHDVDLAHLSKLIRANEHDGKDVPILVKQYAKLGAKFHTVAIDPNFAATPGMLLSVHVPSCPPKSLKSYFEGDYQAYLEYDG